MQYQAYFFILGHNPALSIAEILAVLERERINYKINGYSDEVLLIDTPEDISPIWQDLGGSIKFGKIINARPQAQSLLEFLPLNDHKVYFGFSVYEFPDFFYKKDEDKLVSGEREPNWQQKQKELQGLAMEIKKFLRARGQSARFVTSRERALSSVIVKTNKLLTGGAEFVFLFLSSRFHGPNHGTVANPSPKQEPRTVLGLPEHMLTGKTLAVQEFDEYERRDYGRPRRDILRGMLPPKIAKIMINLAGLNREAKILDPFCGVGTTIGEAAVLGYKNLICADIDSKAIADAKVNLEWIKKQYNINPQIDFLVADARNLKTKLQSHSLDRGTVDAIITEPYLGPLLRGQTSEAEILKIKKELEDLYSAAFQSFQKILKPNGQVVFIFPVWRTKQKNIFIDLNKVLPPQFKIKNLCDTSRGSIIWQRPDQKVLREIILMKLVTPQAMTRGVMTRRIKT